MKKRTRVALVWLFTLAFLLAFPLAASADLGPKPQLTVIVKNPPPGEYYLDLLVNGSRPYDNLREKRVNYKGEKLSILESYNQDGWYPALIHGNEIPMQGSPVGEKSGDTMVHKLCGRAGCI